MAKLESAVLGHIEVTEISLSDILPAHYNIKVAKTFFPSLYSVCY